MKHYLHLIFLSQFLIISQSGIGQNIINSSNSGHLLKVSQAIDNSIAYFEQNINNIEDASVIITLSLLKEEFDLPMKIPSPKEFINKYRHLSEISYILYNHSWNKTKKLQLPSEVIENMKSSPHKFIDIKAKISEENDVALAWAMFSDEVKLPNNYLSYLTQRAEKDTFFLFPASLALRSIIDNKSWKNRDEIIKAKKTIISSLIEITQLPISKIPSCTPDIRIGALSMLLYLNHTSVISSNWINHILRTQQKDGGWEDKHCKEKSISYSSSTPQSTLLNFWTLLEINRNLKIKSKKTN